MSTTPPGFDPNAPFDPTNVNDPRYDPRRDPRYDPRWQREQRRMWQDQAKAQQRAQKDAWNAQRHAYRDTWRDYWRAHQRPSIVGPLLLIAVGIIFLLIHSGKLQMLAVVAWYSRWWPLLLIAAGLLRLGEWALDRARQPEGAPPVQYRVGGGVVFVVVVLALAGLALHNAGRVDVNGRNFAFGPFNGSDMGNFFGSKHEEDAPAMTHALAADGGLSIDNPHGDVTVSGTSDDGQVHVTVHKFVFTSSDDEATDRLRQLVPSWGGSDNNVQLNMPSVQSGGADISLLVPPTVRLLINSNRGDIRVTNQKSGVGITANNGDVEVAAITGGVHLHVNNRRRDIHVRSVSGDVTVDGSGNEVNLSDIGGNARINGDFFGGGTIEHVAGGVQFASSRADFSVAHLNGKVEMDEHSSLEASDLVGPVSINTRSRNVSLERVSGDVRVTNNHGDVELSVAPPTGNITVDNQNGNVTVSTPAGSKFTLDAETSDGDTHSEFGGIDSTGRGILKGSVNGGGATIRLNTSHGDVSINHNTNGPLAAPPAPPKVSGLPSPPSVPAPLGSTRRTIQDANKLAQDAIRQADEELNSSRKNK